MSIDISALSPAFAAEIGGVDLACPLDPATVDGIWSAIDRYAVVIFRDQRLTDAQLRDFAARFGPLEIGRAAARGGPRRLAIPQIGDISNLDANNKVRRLDDRRRLDSLGNRLWHTDASFRVVPARYSILSGRIVPSEGPDTEFADMRAAYDALDARTKAEVEDMVCEHSLIYSRGQLGFTEFLPNERVAMRPVRQRLVRTHPVTGRKSLFLASHIGTIIGWPRPEAMSFIRDLMEHATQAEFVYVHKWTPHDLVIWDNRVTMHRVRRFDDLNIVRDVRRTTTRSDGPTAEQEAA